MNDKRDMAPMVWGYVKSRETARRMKAYAGEVTGMHPHFAYDSPARAFDMDLATTKEYALKGNLTAGIQHGKIDRIFLSPQFNILTPFAGSWSVAQGPGKASADTYLSSNKQDVRESLQYTKKDIEHVEKWGKFNHL